MTGDYQSEFMLEDFDRYEDVRSREGVVSEVFHNVIVDTITRFGWENPLTITLEDDDARTDDEYAAAMAAVAAATAAAAAALMTPSAMTQAELDEAKRKDDVVASVRAVRLISAMRTIPRTDRLAEGHSRLAARMAQTRASRNVEVSDVSERPEGVGVAGDRAGDSDIADGAGHRPTTVGRGRGRGHD